jgi:uncharacterized RDD family membrane protein YckC
MSAELAITNEETLVIETPERVPLHFALASIGNRFLACAIDHGLQIFLMGLMVIGFYFLADFVDFIGVVKEAPKWIIAILIIVVALIWISYFIFFEWLWSGQTPGKRWLKLRVIREDGRPITFWEASVRNLLRIVDMMPMSPKLPIPFYSLGIISLFVTKKDQRIGDLVAGSVVVREREAEAPTFDQVFAAPVSDTALRRSFRPVLFNASLQAVTAREIEVVEAFLRRRWDLPDHARMWMAWRVATPLLMKLRPQYDPMTFSYEGFLEELLHRYRAVHRFAS